MPLTLLTLLAAALLPTSPEQAHWLDRAPELVQRCLEARLSKKDALLLKGADGKEVAVARLGVVRGLERVVHQREVVFGQGGIRVLQTEEIEGASRRLVYREFRPDGARTWVAEWRLDDRHTTTTGYGWRRRTHGTLGPSQAGQGPQMGALELLERMQSGACAHGESVGVVDPVTAAVLDVRIARRAERLVALRADGTELWSVGADRARGLGMNGRPWISVDGKGYEARAGRWFVPVVPNHERVLGAIRRAHGVEARPASARRLEERRGDRN